MTATRAILLLTALFLVCAPMRACASDWFLPSISQSLAQADTVVIGRVAAVSARTPAESEGPARATVEVEVQDRLKGDAPRRLTVKDLDLGDGQGIKSPFAPLPAAMEGVRLLLLLKPTAEKGIYQAPTRCQIADEQVLQLMLEGRDVPKADLAEVRSAISQLVLIQAVLAAADSPAAAAGLDLAACRIALFSRHAEVVWYAAGQIQQRKLCQSLLAELRASPFFGQDSPTGQRLRDCADKAKTAEK